MLYITESWTVPSPPRSNGSTTPACLDPLFHLANENDERGHHRELLTSTKYLTQDSAGCRPCTAYEGRNTSAHFAVRFARESPRLLHGSPGSQLPEQAPSPDQPCNANHGIPSENQPARPSLSSTSSHLATPTIGITASTVIVLLMLPVFHPFLQHYSLLQKLPSRGAALHTGRICSIRRNKILCLHKVLKAFPAATVAVPLCKLTCSSTTTIRAEFQPLLLILEMDSVLTGPCKQKHQSINF
ncbi:hypothetical protein HDV62DRAFT_142640 [Trichoderma sp. SZMC 28011]